MRNIYVLLLLLAPFVAFSQMPSPVKWTISVSKEQVKAGETIEVILKATINDGWKLYGIGDPEPPHIGFSFEENEDYKLIGKVTEPKATKKGYDSLLEMNVNYFEKTAEFRQKVKILKANPKIVVDIDAQACQVGQCVPVRKTLTVEGLKVIALEEKVNTDQKGSDNKTKQTNTGNSPGNLEALEKEKQKLTKKDSKGNDISINYLKEFVNKYGKQ